MKIFFVFRPHCNPNGFNVIADSEEEAIEISNKTYGYCTDTRAKEVRFEKGILSSSSTTNNSVTILAKYLKKQCLA